MRYSVPISGIVIKHRVNNIERFRNVQIRIGNTAVGYDYTGRMINVNSICLFYNGPRTSSSQNEQILQCSNTIIGRYITIQIVNNDFNSILQLAELRVLIGYIVQPTTPTISIPPTTVVNPIGIDIVQCQNSPLEFDCGNFGNIEILSANYGRTDQTTCAQKNAHNDNCKFNALQKLASR